MTGNTVIDRAWDMLGDIGPYKRNVLATMIRHLNDGVQDLVARRPYMLLLADGTLDTFTELTALTYASQALPADEAFREPLAHYVASRAFESDAADRHNAELSRMHMQTYIQTS